MQYKLSPDIYIGPYAPAVLRFQIAFPQRYPEVPPLVLFTSDVFHPLVTPLTTYTYTTGSNAADPVSATDEERLLPGGFSLRHGFPLWFERTQKTMSSSPMFRDIPKPSLQVKDETRDSDHHSNRPKSPLKGLQSIHMPPPKDEGDSMKDIPPSIYEVLLYLKRAFENEDLLDGLPVEAAGNPGAWHAWRAHRRKVKPSKAMSDSASSRHGTPQRGMDNSTRSKPSGEWNWNGVWVERVKRGVNTSLSESMLFGGVDGDDLVGATMPHQALADLKDTFP